MQWERSVILEIKIYWHGGAYLLNGCLQIILTRSNLSCRSSSLKCFASSIFLPRALLPSLLSFRDCRQSVGRRATNGVPSRDTRISNHADAESNDVQSRLRLDRLRGLCLSVKTNLFYEVTFTSYYIDKLMIINNEVRAWCTYDDENDRMTVFSLLRSNSILHHAYPRHLVIPSFASKWNCF